MSHHEDWTEVPPHSRFFLAFFAHLAFYPYFFSSRRRHTSSDRDWSSDVCSSDLHSRYSRWAMPGYSRRMAMQLRWWRLPNRKSQAPPWERCAYRSRTPVRRWLTSARVQIPTERTRWALVSGYL